LNEAELKIFSKIQKPRVYINQVSIKDRFRRFFGRQGLANYGSKDQV
jgi:hypothetical protein